MPDALPVWAFVAITLPLVLTPGASTAVVLRNAIAGGLRAGALTTVGTNTGSLGYGLLSAFGLAIVLQRWPSIWTVLRVAGVAYLAWLGIQSVRRALVPRQASGREAPLPAPGTWRPLYEGFVTNALNPSIATFYLVVLPQFIPAGAPVARSALALTAIHVGLAAAWHLTWAAAGRTLTRTLSGGRPRQVLEGMSGLALLTLAARIALG